MARTESRSPITRSLGVLACLALLLIGWPLVGRAHSGGEPRLQAAAVGPYRLFVWAQPAAPRVGEYHVTVALTEALADDPTGLNGPPVFDAQVDVRMVHEESGQTLEVRATHEGADNPAFYEARFNVPTPGAWTVYIRVQGVAGSGEASYREIFEPAPASWTLWAAGGGAVLLLIGAVALLFRRTRTGSPASGEETRPGEATTAFRH